MSVNSHEIRRRIDGLAERFMADNYTKYGEHFRELCDRLIDDPLCTGHYEYDISWILLHLLLETSKNPIGALAANKNRSRLLSDGAGHEDDQQDMHVQSERDRIMNDLISSLIRQNIPIDEGIGSQRDGPHDNDSELSVSLFDSLFGYRCMDLTRSFRSSRIGPMMNELMGEIELRAHQ